MAKRRNKGEERAIAQARVDALIDAAAALRGLDPAHPLLARHGQLALRVAERYQAGLSPLQKARLCRKCGALRTAASSRTRVRGGRVATTCLACGHVQRRPLAPRSSAPPASGRP